MLSQEWFPLLWLKAQEQQKKKGIELKKQLGKEQNRKHCYAAIEMHHALILEYYMQLDVVSVILWSSWEMSREKQLV